MMTASGVPKLLLLVTLLAVTPVTKKNWEHHPAIEEVRILVAAVDAAKPHLKKREADCQFETRVMLLDSSGVARFYEWGEGGEDSSYTHAYYYDARGKLRFLHSSGGSVPSASSDTRAWLDSSGKILFKLQKFSGEGMRFDPLEYPDHIVRDPKRHFTSPQTSGPDACAEGTP